MGVILDPQAKSTWLKTSCSSAPTLPYAWARVSPGCLLVPP